MLDSQASVDEGLGGDGLQANNTELGSAKLSSECFFTGSSTGVPFLVFMSDLNRYSNWPLTSWNPNTKYPS